MRWFVFGIAAYIVMVTQVGLAKHLAFSAAAGSIQPEFSLLLAVFIALWAPSRVAVVACGVLGLLIDLSSSPYALAAADGGFVSGPAAVTILGPYTLGYMAGAYLVVQLRPMLFRQHPLTLAAMILVAGAETHLIVLGLLWMRQWYEPIAGFVASQQFIPRALSLLYTAVLGAVLVLPLLWVAPTFGFATAKSTGRS